MTTAERTVKLLRQGDEGPEVGVMQLKLIVLGYLPTGSDTGVFDGATNSAVLSFQSEYGLVVDGLVGPETERSISAAANSINADG
ncbi:peptidoglycan-binding domain-containing protein [Ilumatobacter sp.]|uniref:peptidoglycan-binding domain-containing protein n=1 Tax=Ilumatobacter sp. TaxID=1967498 RepID=UPI003C70121C